MTPDQLCAEAQRRHLAGDRAAAEALYGAALKLDPRHAESLHRLGRLAHGLGQSERALALIEQAVTLKPRNAAYRDAHGLALRLAGRNAEAVTAFRHAVRLDPSSFAAHYNLGNALAALGQHAQAAQCFRRAIAIDAKFAGAHNNLGDALRALGDFASAAEAFQAALALAPGAFEIHFNLAAVLLELQRDAAAAQVLTRALAINPGHRPALNLLRKACLRLNDFARAEQAVRRALALAPEDANLTGELAILIQLQERWDEAGPVYARAVELAPLDPQLHANHGNWLRDTGDLAGSEARLRAGLAVAPEHPQLHYALSHTLLCMGRMREGFAEYEWRWKALNIPARFAAPAWTGERDPARTLLISIDQGHGDMIQFLRYVPLAPERMRVVLEVYPGLRRLAGCVPGIASLFSPGEPEPAHDVICPLLSLPRLLGLDEAALGMDADAPYLRPDPADAAHWAGQVAALPGRKVGLVWAGAAEFARDRGRSVPPALLDVLARDDVSYVSLQKDAKAKPGLPLTDWTPELRDFADTAALIVNLDLVISVDTAVAHLAGALGKPVWLLNRFDSDWRWLREGNRSAWYPTLRQFRQPRLGDWASVMEAVRTALEPA